jgi:hypothetical protein
VAGGSGRLHDKELHKPVRFTKYYYGDQVKEDEMSGACSTRGSDQKRV